MNIPSRNRQQSQGNIAAVRRAMTADRQNQPRGNGRGVRLDHIRREAEKLRLWVAAGVVTGTLAVGLAVLVVVALTRPSPSTHKPGGTNRNSAIASAEGGLSPSVAAKPLAGTEAPCAPGTLIVELGENERADTGLFIDRQKQSLPTSGPASFTLASGYHRLRLARRGYEPLEVLLTLAPRETRRWQPQWRALPPPPASSQEPTPLPGPTPPDAIARYGNFDGWVQDYEEALRRAAAEVKDVLIVFSGSDWCGWCRRLAEDVVFQPEFRQAVDRTSVLVYVDFPKGPEAKQKVQDAKRNEQLRDEFHITGFPTVILTDPQRHVLGVQRGCGKDGASGFVSRLAEWRDVGKTLHGILRELDDSDSPDVALRHVERAAALVDRRGLKDFYGTAIDQWRDIARRAGPRVCPAPQPLAGVRPDAARDALPVPSDLTGQALLSAAGLTPLHKTFSLDGESNVRELVEKTQSQQKAALDARRALAKAEKVVEAKEQTILALQQQRAILQQQLARSPFSSDRDRLAAAIASLDTRLMILRKCQSEEQGVEHIRAKLLAHEQAFIEHVLATRSEYDKLDRQYQRLGGEPRVAQAIQQFNEANGKGLTPGPSSWFSATGRRLKSWEESVLTEEVPLRRGVGGLWMVSTMLNGRHATEMAIDTGASAVALPWNMAVAAGLKPNDSSETVFAQVANGAVVQAKRIIAPSLRVGKFTVQKVPCLVLLPEATAAGPLLGQSFLGRFNLRIEAGRSKLILQNVQEMN